MNNNTKTPPIEFSEWTTYDALYALLFQANVGLFGADKARNGYGFTYQFHTTGGGTIIGTFLDDETDGDTDLTVIALHTGGNPNGETITVRTDDIVKVVYL